MTALRFFAQVRTTCGSGWAKRVESGPPATAGGSDASGQKEKQPQLLVPGKHLDVAVAALHPSLRVNLFSFGSPCLQYPCSAGF
jgi:hypothetical protein